MYMMNTSFCVSFQISETLTTTALLGATFTEAPRSSGSSAPCPNALKVPLGRQSQAGRTDGQLL